tara:strand:+ start:345 stop:800 length:456 start_codon:yes stop_codon:yes gene_type:complete
MVKKLFATLIFLSLLPAQIVNSSNPLNGEQYITGDDGVVRMYVNVWGHVKVSGTFLIFEGADLINALSVAGGPLEGANLEKIKIVTKDSGEIKFYSVSNFINNSNQENLKLNPYDTIIVNQTLRSRILSRSNLISSIFQLINLLYTIDRLD